ncbi:ferredoxin [Nocardia sp. NPDC050408]|uniref:ferredoxin n=1 Tax=Nocardia sp. NPDC050408 TaxID=3364319 RepID=UPI0037A16081
MTKLRLDRTLCDGYGTCADEYREAIELDEFGYAQLTLTDTIPTDEMDKAQAAVAACPKRAISLVT